MVDGAEKRVKGARDASKNGILGAPEPISPRERLREGEHISTLRADPDGTKTPLTMPNHRTIKGPTLQTICAQAAISRVESLEAFEQE